MRKTLFVLIIALLLVLTGCQQTDNNVSESDTTAPPIIFVTETQEVVTSTEQTSSTEETKETESNTAYEETETASVSTTSKPVITETKPPSTTDTKPKTTTETTPSNTEHTETETKPTETAPPPVVRPSGSEVAAKVAVYINQYRSSSATVLPGLGNVALYRANELIANFAHTDGISACNALQYGEFVDMTLYGMSESDSYYQGYNREAIAKGNWGGTADEIAQRIANGFKNSASHWKYLGSSEYSYMAVGCVYDKASSMWYCCICVSSKNYGG